MLIFPYLGLDVYKPSRYRLLEIKKYSVLLFDIKWGVQIEVKMPFYLKTLMTFGLANFDFKRLSEVEEKSVKDLGLAKEMTTLEDALSTFDKAWQDEALLYLTDNSYYNTMLCDWNKKFKDTDTNWYMNPWVVLVYPFWISKLGRKI